MATKVLGKEKDSARNTEYRELTVSQIQPSGYNPRKKFDPKKLEELSASMREQGLLEPIVVRPLGEDKYEIIAGERRWWAAGRAKLQTIPARILHGIDDNKARELALLENLVRADLDPIEEANGYQSLIDLGYTQKKIGEKIGRKQATIANMLRLLKLPDSVKTMVQKSEISMSHARALVPYSDHPELLDALAGAAAKGATTKQLESFKIDDMLSYSDRHKLPIKQLENWEIHFDRTACNNCPNQKRNYCLDPGCWTEKQRVADKERKAASEAKIAEMANGQELLNLKGLDRNTYVWLNMNSLPTGCSGAECEYHKIGFWSENPDHICMNPSCHAQLTEAEEKHRKEENEIQVKSILDAALMAMDTIEVSDNESSRKAVALALTDSFQGDEQFIRKAAQLLSITVSGKKLADYAYSAPNKIKIAEILCEFSAITQIKLAVLTTLSREAEYIRDGLLLNNWFTTSPGDTDWNARLAQLELVEGALIIRKDRSPDTTYYIVAIDADRVGIGEQPGKRMLTLPTETLIDQFELKKISKEAGHLIHTSAEESVRIDIPGCNKLDVLCEALEFERAGAARVTLIQALERRIRKLKKITPKAPDDITQEPAPDHVPQCFECAVCGAEYGTQTDQLVTADGLGLVCGSCKGQIDTEQAEEDAVIPAGEASAIYSDASKLRLGSLWKCVAIPEWVVCVTGNVEGRICVETLANAETGSQRPRQESWMEFSGWETRWTQLHITRTEFREQNQGVPA